MSEAAWTAGHGTGPAVTGKVTGLLTRSLTAHNGQVYHTGRTDQG